MAFYSGGRGGYCKHTQAYDWHVQKSWWHPERAAGAQGILIASRIIFLAPAGMLLVGCELFLMPQMSRALDRSCRTLEYEFIFAKFLWIIHSWVRCGWGCLFFVIHTRTRTHPQRFGGQFFWNTRNEEKKSYSRFIWMKRCCKKSEATICYVCDTMSSFTKKFGL